MLDSATVALLRCPASGQSLRWVGDQCLTTEDRLHAYPVVNGIPILIDDEHCIFSADEIRASVGGSSHGRRGARQILRGVLPSHSLSVGSGERYARFGQLVRDLAGERKARVLIVGGGEMGRGMERLTASEGIELVETDIYAGPRVDIICDGHRLPFADETFDGVVAQAVLEHVLSPAEVVAEMHRVLRPAGIVYAETPFMQQVHEGAYDFCRFTDLGHRRLFRFFVEIERGVAVGPGTAFLWSLRYLARSFPRRSRLAANVLDKLVTIGFFWLKYLDSLLADHPGARDAASGLFFMGRRSDTPLPDRQLVAGYQGMFGSIAVARGIDDQPSSSN